MQRAKHVLLSLIKYSVGIAAIIYVFRRTDFSGLNFNPLFQPTALILLIATRLCGYYLVSLRWKIIMGEMGVSVPTEKVFRFNIIALSLSYFVPGSITADLGKGMLLGKHNNGDYKKILVSIFLDRIVGLSALLLLFVVGFGLAWQFDANRITAISELLNFRLLGGLLAAGAAIFLFLLLKPNNLTHKLKKLNLGFQAVRISFWLKVLALSLLCHSTFIVFMMVVASAMNLSQITWLSSTLVFPVASLSLVIPLTPGATGVGQLVYQFFLNLYSGYQANDGTILFTISQMTELLFVLLGVVFFVLNKKKSAVPIINNSELKTD